MSRLLRTTAFIDGKPVDAPDHIDVVNPSDGSVLASVASGSAAEVDAAVDAARRAFEDVWRHTTAAERGALLRNAAHRLARDLEEVAMLESLDTGKPLRQARADASTAVRYLEFFGGLAEGLVGSTIPTTSDVVAMTVREPYGVTAHIGAWNYPLQIAVRSIAPALAAGNTCVLKPAELAPLTSLALGEIFADAGLPAGVFNVVPGLGHEAGAALAGHGDIDHLAFTGSQAVGSQVMALAAPNVVPVSLELGGKSPNIVFDDAHRDELMPFLVNSVIQNAGQTCSAGSRLLVQESIHADLVAAIVERFSTLRIGPGPDDLDLGPLISARQQERVQAYVDEAGRDSQVLSAAPAEGSSLPAGGFYFAPTVIDGVDPSARIAQEEVFGPVLAVSTFASADEAIEIANGTDYGLIAALWTRDVGRAHRVAREIRAGQVFINSYGAGGGVELPFGGYKRSGFGREKGWAGLESYTQLKTITVKLDNAD